MSDTRNRCAEALHDLAENAGQALELARDLIAWLGEHGEDDALLLELEGFVARPDLPRALQLEPRVGALDTRLRHASQPPKACHRLANRLGAMKRIAHDLRALDEPSVTAPILDGQQGLLDLEKTSPPVAVEKEALSAFAVPDVDAIRLVMIVEDDAWWRSRLEAKAMELFPGAACESYETYASAVARFEVLERDRPFLVDRRNAVARQAVLVLLDLGLPEVEGGDDDTSRGMALLARARAYENLWRVVVVTRPRNYLEDQRAATSHGVQPEDYIFKIDEAWEAEIDESLRRLGTGGLSRVDIIHDDELGRGTIRAGDVEFTLDGRPYLLLKALAEMRGQAASEERILEVLDDGRATGFSDTLLKLRQAFVDAWAEVGRPLSPADVLRNEDGPAGRPVYRLLPTASIVEATDEPEPPRRATRALVVDDEIVASREVAGWLERLGLEVRTAECGEEAARVAAEFVPHIVCLDLALPWKRRGTIDPRGGLQALDAIRDVPGLADVRALVISAYADDDGIRRAGLLRGVRVDDWLHKRSEHLEPWVVRSCARLQAEIERGVVLSARARSPWVLRIARTRPWAALDDKELRLGKGGWQLLAVLAEKPWLPVSTDDLVRALGLEDDASIVRDLQDKKIRSHANALRGRAKRLRDAAGEPSHASDTFIKAVPGGYVLRATVIWVD